MKVTKRPLTEVKWALKPPRPRQTLSSGLCKKPFRQNTLWNNRSSPQRKVTPTEKQLIFHRTNSKSSSFPFPVPKIWYFFLKFAIPFHRGTSAADDLRAIAKQSLLPGPYLQKRELQSLQSRPKFALQREKLVLSSHRNAGPGLF